MQSHRARRARVFFWVGGWGLEFFWTATQDHEPYDESTIAAKLVNWDDDVVTRSRHFVTLWLFGRRDPPPYCFLLFKDAVDVEAWTALRQGSTWVDCDDGDCNGHLVRNKT